MEEKVSLLRQWLESSRVMHIGHLMAAARYATYHVRFGVTATALSALVSSSVFVTLQQQQDRALVWLTAILSVGAAAFTSTNVFLRHDTRSERHHQAATHFQGLRREIEEELAFFHERNDRSGFEVIRDRWSTALASAPPLPQDIHDDVKHDKAGRYSEVTRESKRQI